MRKLVFLFIFSLLWGCAGTRSEKPPIKSGWVEKTLSTMSVEQKIGQMMAPAFRPVFYNDDNSSFKRLVKLVKQYHIGGAMFYRGNPYAVARDVQRLQDVADLPLLIMADFEWGISMRINEGTGFLQNMGVGATGSEAYAYEMGKITAQEGRAFGVHVAYAPVMDVNNNPDNIIINTRSYGEDPQLVGRLGTSFIRGLQEHGLYATMKHFPGHGDTDVDSHLGLPTITASAERIRNVELPPFKAAVEAGVKCVMVAHITYSAFPQMEGRPATLDPFFIKNVLRGEMGFDGLVFSDAMDMGGITKNYWGGEAAVLAINAGVDMVLIPPDFEQTYKFVVQAVQDGRISMETIDAAVRRILQAKFEQGLYQKPSIDLDNIEKIVANPVHLQKANEIADAAMTLLRDEKNVLPLATEKLDSVLVVTVTDRENSGYGASLNREVQRRVPFVKTALVDPRSTPEEIAKIITYADSVDAVITGVFVTWGSYKGSATLPDTTTKLLTKFFNLEKPMAVVSFGSPYILRSIPEVPTYLCAYGTNSLATHAAMRAVFGEISITGKLPVSIPGFYNIGDGLKIPARKMELVKDINDDILKDAYDVLEKAIADSVFPGAQIAVLHDDKLIASRGFGHQFYDPNSAKVDTKTIYDLASVTKVIATTTVSMMLWEKGRLQLDIPIKSYLPKFHGGLKDSVTFRHLLTHSSGAHWWVDLWNKTKNKAEALDYIYQLPLDFTPGDSMIYSDLGLIMGGEILQTISGKRIDELSKEMLYNPLGMRNTMYNPPKSLLPRIAPTEIGGSMNRGLIHGDVHDENTFFFSGVSSHAGLFSTAEDLAKQAQMLLNGGVYQHRRYMWPSTIKYWTSRQHMPEWSSRALGWDTPSEHGSLAGDYFSKGSFGHTGFTGTSIWIDPNRKIAIILLTNRVHPTRKRGGIREVRRAFYNATMKALLNKMGEEVEDVPKK